MALCSNLGRRLFLAPTRGNTPPTKGGGFAKVRASPKGQGAPPRSRRSVFLCPPPRQTRISATPLGFGRFWSNERLQTATRQTSFAASVPALDRFSLRCSAVAAAKDKALSFWFFFGQPSHFPRVAKAGGRSADVW